MLDQYQPPWTSISHTEHCFSGFIVISWYHNWFTNQHDDEIDPRLQAYLSGNMSSRTNVSECFLPNNQDKFDKNIRIVTYVFLWSRKSESSSFIWPNVHVQSKVLLIYVKETRIHIPTYTCILLRGLMTLLTTQSAVWKTVSAFKDLQASRARQSVSRTIPWVVPKITI